MPTHTLAEFLADCLPGFAAPAEAAALRVRPDVDLPNRKLTLHLYADTWLEPSALDGFKAALEQVLSPCRVNLEFYYPPEAFTREAFPWVLRALKTAEPIANGFLRGAGIEIDGLALTLRLLLLQEAGVNVLLQQKADVRLSAFIESHFGLKLNVHICVGSAAPGDIVPEALVYGSAPQGAANAPQGANHAPQGTPNASQGAPNAPQGAPRHPAAALDADLYKGLPFTVEGSKTIYGPPIKSRPMDICTLDPQDGSATIWGEVFGFEERQTRKGDKKIMNFCVTDYTSSYSCKLFEDLKNCDTLLSALSDGVFVLLRGEFEMDRFSQSYILKPKSIATVRPIQPTDNAPEKRVELHCHTNMSRLDALPSVEDLCKRAAAWGHPAIAVTDHGVVQSFPAAREAGKKYGVKILYGMEGYYVDDLRPAVLLGTEKPDSIPFDAPICVFDVETTGLSPSKDRMIQIGAVRIAGGKTEESFNTYIDPEREIPERILELTHIQPIQLVGAPKEAEALERFLAFAEGCVLCAHNAAFDMSFLRAAARRHTPTSAVKTAAHTAPCIDTMVLAQKLLPDLANYKLDTLTGHYKLGSFAHHSADDDARVTALALLCLMEEARRNYPTCGEDLLWFNMDVQKPNPKRLRPYHIILLVKNITGLKNLYKLITASNVEWLVGNSPRIPRSALLERREGLVLGSACDAGELYRAILDEADDEELRRIASFYDYLEIQPLGNTAYLTRPDKNTGRIPLGGAEEQREVNRRIAALGDQLGIPVCATGDVHFLDEKDAKYREVLMGGQGYTDAANQAPLFYKTTEQMIEEFAYLGKDKALEVVVTNPRKIADTLESVPPFLEGTYTPVISGSDEKLRTSCYRRMKAEYGDPLPAYVQERLDKELDSIIKNGFAVLYVIARELVKGSEDRGYKVGSRGSVGSSFAAYAAGISEVNPLVPHYLCKNCKHSEFFTDGSKGSGYDLLPRDCPKCGTPMRRDGHDIPFETFLGFDGDKSPDIDLNFAGEDQWYAHRQTEEIFGKDKVFKAGTIATIAEKNALGYVKKYLETTGQPEPSQAEMKRWAKGITGVKRTTGQHPGGMVVIPAAYEAEDFTPIQFPADKSDGDVGMTTHFDFHSLHDTILKLDNLGHDVPTIYHYLEKNTGIDVADADVCDRKLYELFASPKPLGVTAEEIGFPLGTLSLPELATPFVVGMLQKAQPKNFSDLLQISGLSHGTGVWLGNAAELIAQGVCTISDVIGTRDSIMTYLIHHGVEPLQAFKIMEIVRKGKAKKLLTEEMKEEIRTKAGNWYLDSCMKIEYMFPKAHAAAYVMAAMRLAWFKLYHPVAYYASYMSVRGSDLDTVALMEGKAAVRRRIAALEVQGKDLSKKDEDLLSAMLVCQEMLARGIEVLPVDLNLSDVKEYLIEGGKIRLPFSALSGVGENAAKSLAAARKDGRGAYLSIEELKDRTKVSSQVIDALEAAGALKGMAASNQVTLFGF